MMYSVNETHDQKRKSWVESANEPGCDFPIQNLPFGLFTCPELDELPAVGVAIGDQILDLSAVAETLWADDFDDQIADACSYESFDLLLMLGPEGWSELRRRLSDLLNADNDDADRSMLAGCLVPMSEAAMLLPVEIGDYTDFYASVFHATSVGSMFRPDNPLLPNYKYVPIAYHGRASSVIVSGTPVIRPQGQIKSPDADVPQFAPSRLLDYEVEVGFIVGDGNTLGEPVSLSEAENHIFGLCLVNDWSARDIQSWEYQPLGPFLAKSFATTISPWLVTMEALAPFRVPAFKRPEGDPPPLPYLASPDNQEWGGVALQMELLLATQQMREQRLAPVALTQHNARDLYWTFAQMLTHHTSNGCNLRAGDLIASGTVSGPEKNQRGCLLELTWRGAEPITLPNGETRSFLADGDEVIIRGWCERADFARIGFGECRGIVQAAT